MPVTNLASPCLTPGFFLKGRSMGDFMPASGAVATKSCRPAETPSSEKWAPSWIRSGKAPAERDTFSASGDASFSQAGSFHSASAAGTPHKTRTLPTASTTFLALADNPTASPSPHLSRPVPASQTRPRPFFCYEDTHRANSYTAIQLYKGFSFRMHYHYVRPYIYITFHPDEQDGYEDIRSSPSIH